MAASLFFKHRRLLLCLPRQKGGKTELGVRLLEDLTSRPFTSSSLFLAKSQASQRKAAREKFMRLFDDKTFSVNTEFIYNKAHPTSCIFMGSVDKDPDKERGGTHAMIHWSEVAFSKIDHGETITGVFSKVIQPTLTETNGMVLLESTNNGKNGWYDIWENYRDFGFARLKLSLADYVYLGLVSEEEYNTIKSQTLPDVFRQEYECDFVSFKGKVYEFFDAKKHVHEFDGPKSWQMVISGIDWGFHPSATCVLFAYVENGHAYIFDEHYAMRELPSVTGIKIKERFETFGFDSQHFAAVGDHDTAKNEELNRAQIDVSSAAKSNVLGVRLQIATAFYLDRIHIHPRCKNLIRDLEAACWNEKKDGELDDSQCTWGHFDAEAALRYLIRELGHFEKDKPEENPHAGRDDASARAWAMRKRRERGDDD
jgi:hypothetical protein